MTKEIAIAPHHNTGFIIVPPPPVEDNEFPLQFSFYGYNHSDTHRISGNRDAYYMGCLVGDPYKDNDFAKKLERVRAILHLRGVQRVRRARSKVSRLVVDSGKYSRGPLRVTSSKFDWMHGPRIRRINPE